MKHPHPIRLSNPSKASRLVAIGLTALAAACHHGGSRHRHVVHSEVIFATEFEPNEFVEDANFIGFVRPGREFVIDGFVSEVGPDQFDHYAFEVSEPVEVEFYVDAIAGSGDLEVCIYDPVLDEYVFCFENPGNEFGFFDAPFVGESFQIVVYSFSGSAEYELDVILNPYIHFLEAEASSDPEGAPVRRSVLPSKRNEEGRVTHAPAELESSAPDA